MTKSIVFWRSLVSVNEEMPRSYLPAARPGMMLSNGMFSTFGVSPMIWPSAFEMSASAPITVVLSLGPKNSIGG